MIVTLLKGERKVYTSNVYLVSGDMRRMKDVNTLVDAGSDPTMLPQLASIYAGVGKAQVEQIVLTHGHSDHVGMLSTIKNEYGAKVLAAAHAVAGVDRLLVDGEMVQMGDRMFEVIHMPGHSQDSICLYCEEDSAVFVGDSPVLVMAPGGTYEMGFIRALTRLSQKRVKTIYFGHGDPAVEGVQEQLAQSLENVLKGQISLKS